MRTEPVPGLFITATNTEAGKTWLTCLIARELTAQGLRVGVYKPVASGVPTDAAADGREDDPFLLWDAAGRPAPVERVCPQQFAAPLAPHLAAAREGRRVDEMLLRDGLDFWRRQSDIILVEGVGGLLSPISDADYAADLAYEFGYPLIVVAPNELGVINQTLQTLVTATTFQDGMEVAGIVLNHTSPDDKDMSIDSNRSQLELHCVPPVLGEIGCRSEKLDRPVDWAALAAPPREVQERE